MLQEERHSIVLIVPYHHLNISACDDGEYEDEQGRFFDYEYRNENRPFLLSFGTSDTMKTLLNDNRLIHMGITPGTGFRCLLKPSGSHIDHFLDIDQNILSIQQDAIKRGFIKNENELIFTVDPFEEIWYKRVLLSQEEMTKAKQIIYGTNTVITKKRRLV